jgi:hypothetical protein
VMDHGGMRGAAVSFMATFGSQASQTSAQRR